MMHDNFLASASASATVTPIGKSSLQELFLRQQSLSRPQSFSSWSHQCDLNVFSKHVVQGSSYECLILKEGLRIRDGLSLLFSSFQSVYLASSNVLSGSRPSCSKARVLLFLHGLQCQLDPSQSLPSSKNCLNCPVPNAFCSAVVPLPPTDHIMLC